MFVSSHLLSELEMYVDDLVVVGAGQLITEGSLADFTSRAGTTETVRGPAARRSTSSSRS